MRGPSERCCAPSPPSLGPAFVWSPVALVTEFPRFSQRLATATRLEVRAQKKSAKQAPRAAGDENADPQLRPGRAGARPPQAPSSVPGPTETSTQPDRVPKAPPPTKRPRAPPILQTLASAERKEVRPRKKAAGRDCAAAPPAAAPARAPVGGNTPTSRLDAAPGAAGAAAGPAATAAAGAENADPQLQPGCASGPSQTSGWVPETPAAKGFRAAGHFDREKGPVLVSRTAHIEGHLL